MAGVVRAVLGGKPGAAEAASGGVGLRATKDTETQRFESARSNYQIFASGHLIVARELFGWEFAYDLTFDAALHLGTTAAVIAFFWSEWLVMLRSGWQWLSRRDSPVDDPGRVYDTRLLIVLAIGSIPAAIAGVFFEAVLDVRSPIIVGIMLIVFAVSVRGRQVCGR